MSAKPSTIIMAILLFALVITVFGQFVATGMNDYNQTDDGGFVDYIASVNATSQIVASETARTNQAFGKVGNSTAPSETSGIVVTSAVWNSLTIVGNSIGSADTIAQGTGSKIGIPAWITALASVALLIFIISVIAGRIFGRDI